VLDKPGASWEMKQYIYCTYRATIVAVENQQVLHILSVCL